MISRLLPLLFAVALARGAESFVPVIGANASRPRPGKDFWANPVFADMLFQMNDRLHPYITTGEGDAKSALDALAGDWNKTLGN